MLENRLKQTEEVLVVERLAERSTESAQQMVGAQSAGIKKSFGATGLVGAKETGEPPASSGESGLSSQAGTLPCTCGVLSSGVVMVTGLLRNVVTKERDPAVADRKRVSLVGRRIFSSGLEAWKQLCRVFEPWVSSRFQWMLHPGPLPSTRTDSSVRENQRLSGDRTSENVELAVLQRYQCNGESARQPGQETRR